MLFPCYHQGQSIFHYISTAFGDERSSRRNSGLFIVYLIEEILHGNLHNYNLLKDIKAGLYRSHISLEHGQLSQRAVSSSLGIINWNKFKTNLCFLKSLLFRSASCAETSSSFPNDKFMH